MALPFSFPLGGSLVSEKSSTAAQDQAGETQAAGALPLLCHPRRYQYQV